MKLSYWEYKTWLSNIDFTIVGSGIVGLNCALHLKKRFPSAKILVLEKGILPQGASTKNAGFACFGSISEILADLKQHTEDEVLQLVKKRWDGVQLLRQNIGDVNMDFQNHGGHEVFMEAHTELHQSCLENIGKVNQLLAPVFGNDGFQAHPNSFNFTGIQEQYITNTFESQIDTGKMIAALLQKVQKAGVVILNAIQVEAFEDAQGYVAVKTDQFEFKTDKLLVATNGFASQLIHEDVQPARAQVLVTKPIENLKILGTFHLDEGYYYFRNIEDRILFGGGRNLDFKGEETTSLEQTELIQNKLDDILKHIILPNTPFEVDQRWSGIMGMGTQKCPIIKQISENVSCGVRLGGMGIAIGSLIGKELAELV
ncbi:NAD(P)/FAD-dependent oxidoreductase [Sediminicola arcticus]|uniref:FAD-dependent oxidoreductase n=1 Tax=Sediminicola arcticus TaxID=1574308 RepID=A0ABV2SQK9_9FLAO